MRSTRLLICAAFVVGASIALFVEHIGELSPGRTLAFLGICVAIGWFGRLTFEHPA